MRPKRPSTTARPPGSACRKPRTCSRAWAKTPAEGRVPRGPPRRIEHITRPPGTAAHQAPDRLCGHLTGADAGEEVILPVPLKAGLDVGAAVAARKGYDVTFGLTLAIVPLPHGNSSHPPCVTIGYTHLRHRAGGDSADLWRRFV